jgi:cytochrome P450
MTALLEPPTMNIRFTDDSFVADPWGTLESIRRAGPVVYSAGPIAGDLAAGDGYMVTGHRNCARVLGNARKFRSVPEWFVNKFGGLVFEAFDDSPHNELRAVWAHEFERATLQQDYRSLVEEVVDEQLEGFVTRVRAGETPDAVAELHGTIPLFVMLRMMGLDTSDAQVLGKWADELSGIEAAPGAESLNSYLAKVVAERRHGQGRDLISLMARSDVANSLVTERDIVANATQLVFAGSGTTMSLMSSCLLMLAEAPEQRDLLNADRSLVPRAVEEVLRLRTVAQLAAPRVVTDGPADIDGVRVPEGGTVVCLLGAANRDPERWQDPAKFDVMREQKQHLGFGFGMHNCLGLNLARLEVEIYLNRMLDLIPNWRIAEPVEVRVDAFVGVGRIAIAAG